MTPVHVLSLGAGVQSTCVYLMGHEGVVPLTHAIFADTGEEKEDTMAHLQWLDNLHSIPIHIVSRGRLGDDVLAARRTGTRSASIPAFSREQGRVGMLRRQCTKEYKTEVVDRCLRRDILGLRPRQHIPKDVHVHYYFGISADEARRTKGILRRFAALPWATVHFPLIDRWMTRADCLQWMAGKVPHPVPSSSCVFCPFHDNTEWREVKANPQAWARAVYLDDQLRRASHTKGKVMKPMYLHRSCEPLATIDFTAAKSQATLPMFTEECEGMCGN